MACDLYTSSLFRLSYMFANQLSPDGIFILSAKYGLVRPEQIIEPYDATLVKMSFKDVKLWAQSVLKDLRVYSDLNNDHFIILAGQSYRKYLINELSSYAIPMLGLRIGEQLQYLKRNLDERNL